MSTPSPPPIHDLITNLNFDKFKEVLLYLLNKTNDLDQKIDQCEPTTPIETNRVEVLVALVEEQSKLARAQKTRINTLETTISNLCFNLTGHDPDHFEDEPEDDDASTIDQKSQEEFKPAPIALEEPSPVAEQQTAAIVDQTATVVNQVETMKKQAATSVDTASEPVVKEASPAVTEKSLVAAVPAPAKTTTQISPLSSPSPTPSASPTTSAPPTPPASPKSSPSPTSPTSSPTSPSPTSPTSSPTSPPSSPTSPPSPTSRKTGRRKSWVSIKSQVKRMDPALVKKYRAQFRLFDSDRSGSLEEGEIKALILSLGIVMNDSEITKMLDDNDKDGDRQLDEEEFILMITKTPSLTKKMNIGKTRIKDPKRSLNTRVELLEQHQHKNVAVVKRIEHLMTVMSEQLANSTKENQEKKANDTCIKDQLLSFQKELQTIHTNANNIEDLQINLAHVETVVATISTAKETDPEEDKIKQQKEAQQKTMMAEQESMKAKIKDLFATQNLQHKTLAEVEEKQILFKEQHNTKENDITMLLQHHQEDTKTELALKANQQALDVVVQTIESTNFLVETKADQIKLEEINKYLITLVAEREEEKAEKANNTEEEKVLKLLHESEKRTSMHLSNSMANVNYDIERIYHQLFSKAEGSKLNEMILRMDGLDSISSTILQKVHQKMVNKASVSDMIRIASVTDRLGATVQVLQEAHLGEDLPSASTTAATKCLTCNRSVISVASDSTTRLPPRHLPAQPLQSKLMPLHRQDRSTKKNRRRPQTSTPGSKKRRDWSGTTSSHARPSSSSVHLNRMHSMDSMGSNGSLESLVDAEENGGVPNYKKMTPLFSYVTGCDGRIFRGAST
jgi:hypothetical protein